jgi:FtsP/CotA-like multicopper oxidase with cupredoxin domain
VPIALVGTERKHRSRGGGGYFASNRDPEIAGTFVYHYHVLDHEDGGMMAEIQVNP